jgi:cell wall-associated NlpC family hydrolase/LysM repeat protein
LRSKILALLAAATLPLICGAQNKTYTVRQGDTISSIASRFQIRRAELVAANALSNSHKLQVGKTLRIPASAAVKSKPAAGTSTAVKTVVASGRTYKVRNGDSDWTIARRNGMTVRQLHTLNPNVNFQNLPIGTTLALGGTATTTVAKTAPPVKPAPTKSQPPVKVAQKSTAPGEIATRSYKVKAGDNDWTLARQLDTRVAVLRKINPGVDLDKMRPGQTIRVPAAMGVTVNGTIAANARPATAAPTKTVAKAAAPAASSVSALRSKYAQVAVDSGIIRRTPGVNAEKVTIVDKGTQVAVLGKQGDWYKLRFPRGTVGWMRGDLLKPMQARDVVAPRNTVDPERTIARRERTETRPETRRPSTTRTVASNARPATTQRERTESRPATSTRIPRSSNTRLTSARPGAPTLVARNSGGNSRLLDTAKDQLGIRYRWGGTSRGGFDCSGFVQYVYKKNGVSLPRTSREMASAGRAISRDNLKKGDLILFATRGGRGVSHVGMYIGSGKFIHASSGGGRVRTDSLSSSYYSRRIVTTRRVVSDAKAASIDKPKSAPKKVEVPKVDDPSPDGAVSNGPTR